MYTHENYIWGLVAYGVGFLLMLPFFLLIARALIPWRIPRDLVGLLIAAVLLTPARAYTDMYFLAPAWIVAAFELAQPTSIEGPARALTPMAVVFAVLVAVYIVGRALWQYFLRGRARQN